MIRFLDNFFFEGFVNGNYDFGVTHILSLVLVIFSIIVFSYLLRNMNQDYIYKKMKIIAIIGLIIYFIRRTNRILHGDSTILEAYWPFYLCNINTIFLSIYIIFKIKRGLDFFLVTGLIGGIFTFLIPDGIFTDRYLTFPILDSIISHYVIVVIPMVLFITKAHVLKIKNIYEVLVGLLVVVFNTEVIQRLFFPNKDFVDYLFFRQAIPFSINGVPQIFIIGTIGLITILFIYFLDYVFVKYNHRISVKLV